MKIQILIDNPESWFNKYVDDLMVEIYELGHGAIVIDNCNNIMPGDILLILSCNEIVPDKILKLNKNNIVIHASRLPKGRGWSPLTWQILEGENIIDICLFEAVSKVDSGNIYLMRHINLNGTELIGEIRDILAKVINQMILDYIRNYPYKGHKQRGIPSYYERRTSKDSELDIDKTIKEQFNLLRVVDNVRYPAYFKYNGHKYILLIRKE